VVLAENWSPSLVAVAPQATPCWVLGLGLYPPNGNLYMENAVLNFGDTHRIWGFDVENDVLNLDWAYPYFRQSQIFQVRIQTWSLCLEKVGLKNLRLPQLTASNQGIMMNQWTLVPQNIGRHLTSLDLQWIDLLHLLNLLRTQLSNSNLAPPKLHGSFFQRFAPSFGPCPDRRCKRVPFQDGASFYECCGDSTCNLIHWWI
jgi:hypothetical protein